MQSGQARQQPYTPTQPFEDLTFFASSIGTLGVELELQVLDPTTGELASGAQRILDACAEEGLEGVSGEFLLSMLEVQTDVCHNVAEVRDSLLSRLRRLRKLSRSLGYDLAVAGTHPCARPWASAVFPGERYERIRRRQGSLAYKEHVFGLHIHVGVPGGDEALGLISLLVPYLPHLLALSANSPLWEGVDTGYASARAVMFRPAAHAGVPPHFSGWADFGRYCHFMHQGGVIASTKDLYWDVRARPSFGTIEFRVCDAPASLATLLGLTALARCLVLDGMRLLREHPRLLAGDSGNHWLAGENKWLAARYGLNAVCVRRPGREQVSLAEDTARLLERLRPVAGATGEESFLDALQPGLAESGAERQRRVFRAAGHWQAVVEAVKAGWDTDLLTDSVPAGPRPGGTRLVAETVRTGGVTPDGRGQALPAVGREHFLFGNGAPRAAAFAPGSDGRGAQRAEA